MPLKINPRLINNSPKEAKALSAYLMENDLDFLEKKGKHTLASSIELEITHNMIIDRGHTDPTIRRYRIISNDKFLGKGGFSKVRSTFGYIDVNITTGNISYTESYQDKAVRITNTQSAQKDRNTYSQPAYEHLESVKNHKVCSNFSHIGMELPLEVKKSHAELGLFSKSYALMNHLEGKNLDEVVLNFISHTSPGPDTATMLKVVLLPILKAYKEQVADKGWVHRDIQPANILAHFKKSGSTINFIDMDRALQINSTDTQYGCAGFLPPEVGRITSSNTVLVTQARDIFQLGVLFTGCLNPNFNPNNFFPRNPADKKSLEAAICLALDQIEQNGCYDPEQMQAGVEFFENIEESLAFPPVISLPNENQIRKEIQSFLKEMTHADPTKRPDLDTVISKFEDLLLKLEPPKENYAIKI